MLPALSHHLAFRTRLQEQTVTLPVHSPRGSLTPCRTALFSRNRLGRVGRGICSS
ncbi:hypothetical protein TREES_T100021501 [Tupaia chinensis]|uniref:Uncharacterized protein n=1 Tax=Tupaia chinensis TaxID=246437 RepID=L9KI25_TUPCH|nr:hypothetical protein TREES_T100021501 [Tupaia chinensis]